MSTKTLLEVPAHETVVVTALKGSEACNHRFHELGCFPGTCVTVECQLAFGGPVLISMRDTKFAIRREDAKNIQVSYQ